MEQLRLLGPLAWRNLWRNPRRTLLTMIVVSVGLWSILSFAALLHAWSQSSRDTTLKLLTGQGQIHAPGYLDDPSVARRMTPPDGALAAVLRSNAVSAWGTRVRVPAIVQSEYRTVPITLLGVEPASERRLSTLPDQVVQGRYLGNAADPGIVLGQHLAQRLKTRLGKRVVVMAQGADGGLAERSFRVVGLFGGAMQAQDQYAFSGQAPVQTLLGIGSNISEITVFAGSSEALPTTLAALRRAAPGLDVKSWKQLAPLPYAVSTFFDDFVAMWLGIMFVLMAIGIVNTQLMAVFERTREFGLMKALGMTPRLVMLEVALESALLVGVGVGLGFAAAVGTVAAFHNGLNLGFLARGAELLGAGHVLHPHVNVAEFVGYSLVVWALGAAAALWPAWRAARADPVEAMGQT
jgi:ABC-type lipoprotein release transport system permease subunit